MLRILAVILAFHLTSLAAPGWAFADLNVVTSIKPIQALAAAVMAGAGTPAVIIRGNASPHDYALKPSDARILEEADVVVMVSPGLEVFLKRAVHGLAGEAQIVVLEDVLPLPAGTEPAGEANDHSNHEHEEDLHFWLDPGKAGLFGQAIARSLARSDPRNAALYRANADRLSQRLAGLTEQIEATLAPVRHLPFVTFHAAYGHFSSRFGLAAVEAVTVNPEVKPGARRIREIRAALQDKAVICVFSEPQFNPDMVRVIIEGSNVRAGVLDPLGAALEPGPDLYFTLMNNLAGDLKACLATPS